VSLQVGQAMTSESATRDTQLHLEEALEASSPSRGDAVRFGDIGSDHDNDPTLPKSILARLNEGRHGILEDYRKGSAPNILAK